MTFLGLTLDKFIVILVLAAIFIGPERLPAVAEKFGQFVRGLRDFANDAKSRMRDEMGPEFDEVDWQKLDPRQYDPRRIVREALLDEPKPQREKPVSAKPIARPTIPQASPAVLDGPAPFDDDAT